MANGAETILGAIQPAIQSAAPVSNLIQGFQTPALLRRQALQNELTAAQVQAAPLQQQLLGQRVAAGPEQLKALQLQNQQRQAALDALNVPDETTAKAFAFDAANLSLLPDDQKLEVAENIRAKAVANKRSTENVDEFISTFTENPAKGNQLLDAFIGASEDAGFLASGTKANLEQQKVKLREQELALKQQTEQRQATKLSAASEKALLGSQDLATQAGRNATEFDILANQIRDAAVSGGLAATTSESLKGLLGTQDDVTELRRRFNKVRLSEGLKNLPPGPATDRDVQEAFRGVPPENAPASQIESFLRGAAKMAKFDQAYNEFKAEYITENNNTKGLIKAWKAHAETISDDITGDAQPTQNTFTSSSGISFTVE